MKIRIYKHSDASLKLRYCMFFILLPLVFLKCNQVLTLAAILGICVCACNFVTKKYVLDRYQLTVLCLFVLGECFAIVKSPELLRTLKFTFQKLLVILILYPILKESINTKDKRLLAAKLFKIGCLISSFFVLLHYVLHINVSFVSEGYRTHRLVLAEYGPNVVARLFCIGALYALNEARTETGIKKIICFAEYFFIGFAVMTTVSFSGMILLGLGSFILFMGEDLGAKQSGILKFFAVIVCAAALLFFFVCKRSYFQSTDR